MSNKFFFFECAFILLYYVPKSHQQISDIRKNHVSIQIDYEIENPNSAEHMCSGAIVGDKHVLTSARFFGTQVNGELLNPLEPVSSNIVVVAGINQIHGAGMVRHVRKVIIPRARTTDEARTEMVAILQLEETLRLANNGHRLHAFELDQENDFELYENKDAEVPGNSCGAVWRAENGVLNLQPNPIEIRESLVVRMFGREHSVLYDYLITAVVRERPQLRSCVDSGSPLIYGNKIIGVYILVQHGNFNMLFSRVSKYNQFIHRAMNNNFNPNDMFVLQH